MTLLQGIIGALICAGFTHFFIVVVNCVTKTNQNHEIIYLMSSGFGFILGTIWPRFRSLSKKLKK